MIMKPWKTAAALLAAALAPALGLTSCGDTETEWVTAPTVSAAQAVVTAPDEGGTASVALTVTNPAEGATVSASPSASWVEVTSCTETALALSVSENPNSDPRTARVTITYSYTIAGSKGSCSCEVTVAQSCGDQPAISVQPTAVAAAIEGGQYSFSYTIVNPASDGEVSASCSATWITDIDCSVEGSVGFGVSENTTTALRQAEITISYSWANGSLSESVTVVQDHQGGSGDDGDGGFDGDIEGTYTMTGVCYDSYPYSTSWTVTIHHEPDSQYTDPENPYLIDGLIYAEIGDYPYYAAYCAKARAEGNNIIVPAQITQGGYYLDETYTTEAYLGYVAGYIDGDGYLNAYDSRPDMVFTYNAASESWSCNYGIMGFLYDTPGDFSSESGYFIDFTVGDITLAKSGSGGGGGGGDYPNYSDMTGTYSCSGYGRVSGGYDNATWDMYITAKSDTEYYVYCLTPYAGGLDIADAGEEYWAVAHWGTETTFVIPSQVCSGRVNSSSGATYYWGYTPCTEYDGSSWYYSSQFPDLTFTKTGDNTWVSDYGVFVAGCTGYDITTFESYFGVVAPTIKATKTSNSVPTALSSGRPLGTAETFPNLKASSEPASGSGIRSRRAGARAAR